MGVIASQITSLTIVYSAVYSDADQRKHQSSASLVFVWEITGDRWIPRPNGQLRGKCSIWWRHYVYLWEYKTRTYARGYPVSNPTNIRQLKCPHLTGYLHSPVWERPFASYVKPNCTVERVIDLISTPRETDFGIMRDGVIWWLWRNRPQNWYGHDVCI